MNFISPETLPISASDPSCMERLSFEFSNEKEDYFAVWHNIWDYITTEAFTVSVGGKEFQIPSGTYVLCGCMGGSQDWIQIDELLGREIEVLVIGSNFKSWTMATPVLKKHDPVVSFYSPMTKMPIPIIDDTGESIIIISSVDQYHKLKDRDYDIFFV